MNSHKSAFKLFLKYTPDALEHLFNRCISSFCETEQVQGKIFLDYFLFHPPSDSDEDFFTKGDTGELTMAKILVTHGKQHFLLHPIFETFMKVKLIEFQGNWDI